MGQTVVASSDIIPPSSSSEYSRVEAKRLKSFRGLIVNKTKPIVVSSRALSETEGQLN